MDETSDVLKVDGIGYKFPLGDNITVLVGDGLDASKQFTFACAYGGPSDTLDDCGAPMQLLMRVVHTLVLSMTLATALLLLLVMQVMSQALVLRVVMMVTALTQHIQLITMVYLLLTE